MAEDTGSMNPPAKTHGKVVHPKPEKPDRPKDAPPTPPSALGVTVGDDIGTSESS